MSSSGQLPPGAAPLRRDNPGGVKESGSRRMQYIRAIRLLLW
jgi:hypothetical protein